MALTVSVGKEQRAEVQRILDRRKRVGVGLRFHHGQAFRSGLTQRSGEAEPLTQRSGEAEAPDPEVGRGRALDPEVGPFHPSL